MFNWLDTSYLSKVDETHPHTFMMKELFNLKGVPQPEKWHPEGDAFVHTLMVMDQANKRFEGDFILSLAAMCHDLGKAQCQKTWPSHHGHEIYGIQLTRDLLDRIDVSPNIIKIVEFTTKYHMHVHKVGQLKPSTFIKMWYDADNFLDVSDKKYTRWNKKRQMFNILAKLGVCDHYGRGGVDHNALYYNGDLLIDVAREITYASDFGDDDIFKNKNLLNQIKNIRNQYTISSY